MKNVTIAEGKALTFTIDSTVEIVPDELSPLSVLASTLEDFVEVEEKLMLTKGKYNVKAILIITEDD